MKNFLLILSIVSIRVCCSQDVNRVENNIQELNIFSEFDGIVLNDMNITCSEVYYMRKEILKTLPNDEQVLMFLDLPVSDILYRKLNVENLAIFESLYTNQVSEFNSYLFLLLQLVTEGKVKIIGTIRAGNSYLKYMQGYIDNDKQLKEKFPDFKISSTNLKIDWNSDEFTFIKPVNWDSLVEFVINKMQMNSEKDILFKHLVLLNNEMKNSRSFERRSQLYRKELLSKKRSKYIFIESVHSTFEGELSTKNMIVKELNLRPYYLFLGAFEGKYTSIHLIKEKHKFKRDEVYDFEKIILATDESYMFFINDRANNNQNLSINVRGKEKKIRANLYDGIFLTRKIGSVDGQKVRFNSDIRDW